MSLPSICKLLKDRLFRLGIRHALDSIKKFGVLSGIESLRNKDVNQELLKIMDQTIKGVINESH
jgi:hypothetical protein